LLLVMRAHREPAYEDRRTVAPAGSPALQGASRIPAQLNESESAQGQGILLPLFPQMTGEEQSRVVGALRESLAPVRRDPKHEAERLPESGSTRP